MKKIIILIFILCALTIDFAIAESIEFKPKHVGVVSMMGSNATLVTTGPLVFNIAQKKIAANDWGVNSLIENEIVKVLDRMGVKSKVLSFTDEEKQSARQSLQEVKVFEKIRREEKLANLVSMAKSEGLDSLIIFSPRRVPIPQTKQWLEGYGILYRVDSYYPNRPVGAYFRGGALLIDVKNHGVFNGLYIGPGALIGVKKVLTEQEKEQLKIEFEKNNMDEYEPEEYEEILSNILNPPHHTFETYTNVSEVDRNEIIKNFRKELARTIAFHFSKIFKKELIPAWEDEDAE